MRILFINFILVTKIANFFNSAGGLVTAVAPVVVEAGGLWVGWPGVYSDNGQIEIPEADPKDQSPTAGLKTSQVSIKLTLLFFFL